ncbi:MAG: hybrid sensor histidine kinase/response regulator [Phormidesmis sp.]
MAIDKEQQARLTFLAEAETYFAQIEAVLLALKTTDDLSSQLNIAMRAAHSIKGTAGMMGFGALAQVAHRMEDAFKILQARQLRIDDTLETLLLRGVDCLRTVRQRHADGQPIESEWLTSQIASAFTELHERLGDLTPEEEARLLSEEADENLGVIIFTTSVGDCLDEFAQNLHSHSGEQLRQTTIAMTQQLCDFGLMAQLESFVALCEDVQQQCIVARPEALDAIAGQALNAWQRSHSLVLLGRTERLPTQIKTISVEVANDPAGDIPGDTTLDLLAEDLLAETVGAPDLLDIRPDEINRLQEQLAALDSELTDFEIDDFGLNDLGVDDLGVDDLGVDDLGVDDFEPADTTLTEAEQSQLADIEALQAQFAEFHQEAQQEITLAPDPASVVPEVAPEMAPEVALENVPADQNVLKALEAAVPGVSLNVSPNKVAAPPGKKSSAQPSTVRVSVTQLRQINRLFESLLLNRNAINLRLGQLQNFSSLMQERMAVLASFNTELRQWYDQASSEGLLSARAMGNGDGALQGDRTRLASRTQGAIGQRTSQFQSVAVTAPRELDALELDRYSKLHLLAQENMETIVKLEEVSQDIELGLNEMSQSVRALGYTSQTLKNRITQTQMRSFEEVVGRFPRVVRDWSVQYNKPVNLKIEGETTLLEQFALDQISDPLMHLLRNAFDHGIESPQRRHDQQKPETGTITLRAVNRGNRVVVTLSDDGGGIDLEKVRDRIRQYDLPDKQVDSMDRQELLSFIFEPGFSTTGEVTELSGRGVGMDVVRTNLQQLQGDIQVNTEPGQGTTFTLTIPLSLSILRIMLLERNGFVFALPIDTVQEIITNPGLDVIASSLTWQDTAIPLVRLEDHWSVKYAARPITMSGIPLINHPMVVVVGEGDRLYGLNIDRFWQEQEVAIRPVASPIPLPPGFSGTTILGDGRVVPLMDPIRLMEWIIEKPETSAKQDGSQNGSQNASQTDMSVSPVHSDTARILVVDDSIHARQYLAISLERSGYLVEQAKDGQEAVDKLLAGLSVEAIVCDIEMPRLDGYGLLEELREQPDFSTLPIVMLTSRSGDKHQKLAMNLGATAYFSKPYNEQELLNTLQQLMEKKSDEIRVMK